MTSSSESRQLDRLLLAARGACEHAWTPNSGFPVGAAVLASDGEIVTGCNVESIISGMGTCAERNALHQAVALGLRGRVIAVAVYAPTARPITPCGMCRECIKELAPEARVVCEAKDGTRRSFTVDELLPEAFELDPQE